jgi:hypothetical protein
MWHSCSRYSEDDFFIGKSARVRELYDAVIAFVLESGPFIIDVAKTRIAFQGRVRFAGVTATRNRLSFGFWLKRRIDSPRFSKVEFIPPGNWIYRLPIADERALDGELRNWVTEAYAVGQQAHLRPREQGA